MTSDDRKRELKAQAKAAERQKLIESLPVDIPTLKDLLCYLNKDPAPPCNHTLRETTEFLESRKIDLTTVIPWLQQHGGFCDCEVIYNVYDAVGDLVGWHLDEET
jgi:hypothetical protein